VWDGSLRYLYVDGVEVAKDTGALAGMPSDGGLYFGAGKTLMDSRKAESQPVSSRVSLMMFTSTTAPLRLDKGTAFAPACFPGPALA